jgi:hypothetical protein
MDHVYNAFFIEDEDILGVRKHLVSIYQSCITLSSKQLERIC